MSRNHSQHVTVNLHDVSIGCSAKTRGILRDNIQYRLDIRRRAGDDAQNFARRGLLFQRLVEFLEQPHVLDGDHRLIGKGFDQRNLALCEGLHLAPPHAQGTDRRTILKQRHREDGSIAELTLIADENILRIVVHIFDMDNVSV